MRPHVGLGVKICKLRETGAFLGTVLLCHAAVRGGYNVTPRLQPQMKKYRCLWGMSTANHNILYSLVICGTSSLNTADLPVESSNGLAECGVSSGVMPQKRCRRGFRALGFLKNKRIPAEGAGQGSETVEIGVFVVRNPANSGSPSGLWLRPRGLTGPRIRIRFEA